jgi:hypothetical protein
MLTEDSLNALFIVGCIFLGLVIIVHILVAVCGTKEGDK